MSLFDAIDQNSQLISLVLSRIFNGKIIAQFKKDTTAQCCGVDTTTIFCTDFPSGPLAKVVVVAIFEEVYLTKDMPPLQAIIWLNYSLHDE